MEKKSIFQQLKSVQQIDSNYGNELKAIFTSFLKNERSPFKSEDEYYIKTSVGQGNLATIWWCGIFDIELYKKCYGTTGRIGASKGYYIVFLFNEEKNAVYLSLNQAATGITKRKNKQLLEFVKSTNEYIRSELSKDRIYLRDITGLLSEYGKDLAPDYEQGNILSIEYDLNKKEIDDTQFFDDLMKIQKEYNTLKKMIIDNQAILKNKTKKEEYDLIHRKIIYPQDEKYIDDVEYEFIQNTYDSIVITDSEAKEKSNRKVKFVYTSHGKRVSTDASLRKYVLDKSNYTCQYNSSHETFLTKKDIKYMEIHHLVPLKYQELFDENYTLDRVENLVVLCPTCHRAIHYGTKSEKEKILEPIYNESDMKIILKEKGICSTFKEFIKKFYS